MGFHFYMNINAFPCHKGPGSYDLNLMKTGPTITIAARDDTFDQKCNDNPGKNDKIRNIHNYDKIWQ